MSLYDVTHENIGYVSTGQSIGEELDQAQITDLNATLKKKADWPAALEATVSVRAIADEDDQDEEEQKVFTTVVVRLNASNPAVAERTPVSSAWLDQVIEQFAAKTQIPVTSQENWEVIDVEASPVEADPAPRRGTRPR